MKDSIICIIALIFLLFGVIAIFFERDILREGTSSKIFTRTSGFVVSIISLLVIYYINR